MRWASSLLMAWMVFLTHSTFAESLPSRRVFLKLGEHHTLRSRQSKPIQGTIRWFEIKPLALNYDNSKYCLSAPDQFTGKPTPCHQPLRYIQSEIEPLQGLTEVDVMQIPAIRGAGTYYIKSETLPKNRFQSARSIEVGEAALAGTIQIVIRESDSYLGYLSELFGVPFVMWPKNIPDLGHQTDWQRGADCVATLVYGMRRSGHSIPYIAPGALSRYATEVLPDPDGKTRIRPGDLLYFGFQTAVVATHDENLERLQDSDLIIHSYHKYVERIKWAEVPYRMRPFKVFRWVDQ